MNHFPLKYVNYCIEEEPSSVIAPSEAVSSSELLKSVGKTPTKPDANFSQGILFILISKIRFVNDFYLAFSKSVKIGDLNATNVATKPSAASAQPPLYYDLPPGDQQTLAQTKSPLFQQSSQAPSSTTFSGKIMDSEKNGGESVSPELTASVLGLATAQYQWKARNETELSFARGDIIEILEKGEMRWRGRLQKNRFSFFFLLNSKNNNNLSFKSRSRLVSQKLCAVGRCCDC